MVKRKEDYRNELEDFDKKLRDRSSRKKQFLDKISSDKQKQKEKIEEEKRLNKRDDSFDLNDSMTDKAKNYVSPGPGHYMLNYHQVEDRAPVYSLRGRHDKGFIDKLLSGEDPNRILSINENPAEVLGTAKLPDVSVVKEQAPRFIMPKKMPRFDDEPNVNTNVHSYYNPMENQIVPNNDPSKTF